MKLTFSAEIPNDAFNKFAINHPLNNLFQETRWAQVKSDDWLALRTGLYADEKLCGVALILTRNLPFGFSLWYMPRGPLFDFEQEDLVFAYFQFLKRYARRKRALFIKADPNVLLRSSSLADARKAEAITSHPVIDLMKRCGFQHSGLPKDMYATIQPRFSACFYYEGEDWRAKMSSKTVNLVNKAIQKGVEVEEIGIDRMNEFARIMSLTEKRKGVVLRNETYFKKLKEIYGEDCLVLLGRLNPRKQIERSTQHLSELQANRSLPTLAKHKVHALDQQITSIENEIESLTELVTHENDAITLSCALAIQTGDGLELLYAGMDDRFKKYYAPYVLNFNRIDWGQQRGCVRCNLGGVQGTLDDGLTEYKSAFNPNIDETIGEFDLPVYPLMFKIYDRSLPVFKKLRHLMYVLKKRKNNESQKENAV